MSKRCIGYNDITKEYIYYDEQSGIINSQKELERDVETGLHTITDIWWKITKDFRDENDVKDQIIADLEAKLAESEKEADKYWEFFNQEAKECAELKQQLAEKEDFIEDLMTGRVKPVIPRIKEIEKQYQDKISFAVEQIMQIREKIENSEKIGIGLTLDGIYEIDNIFDNKIAELTHQHEDK